MVVTIIIFKLPKALTTSLPNILALDLALPEAARVVQCVEQRAGAAVELLL